MEPIIALFGEAQKGDFQRGYYCQNLWELSHYLGEPPSQDSQGLEYAVQSLLYQRNVIYFRVHEEGFSFQDYLRGLSFLEERREYFQLTAIALPGVGSREIIEATHSVCNTHQSFLIVSDKDLYDYLTSLPQDSY